MSSIDTNSLTPVGPQLPTSAAGPTAPTDQFNKTTLTPSQLDKLVDDTLTARTNTRSQLAAARDKVQSFSGFTARVKSFFAPVTIFLKSIFSSPDSFGTALYSHLKAPANDQSAKDKVNKLEKQLSQQNATLADLQKKAEGMDHFIIFRP